MLYIGRRNKKKREKPKQKKMSWKRFASCTAFSTDFLFQFSGFINFIITTFLLCSSFSLSFSISFHPSPPPLFLLSMHLSIYLSSFLIYRLVSFRPYRLFFLQRRETENKRQKGEGKRRKQQNITKMLFK